MECGRSCVLLRSSCGHLGSGAVSGTLDEHTARIGKLIIKLLCKNSGHWFHPPLNKCPSMLCSLFYFSPFWTFPFPHLPAEVLPSASQVLFWFGLWVFLVFCFVVLCGCGFVWLGFFGFVFLLLLVFFLIIIRKKIT